MSSNFPSDSNIPAMANPSLNPYTPSSYGGDPGSEHSGANPAAPFPTAITVIAIIFIVFGALGIFTALMSALSTIVFSMLPAETMNDPAMAPMKAVQETKFVPIGIACLNAALSVLFITTGVGLLKKQGWGARIGVIAACLAIVYKIIEAIGNIYIQMRSMGSIQQSIAKSNPNVDFDAQSMQSFISVASIISSIVMMIPFIIFYAWVAYYLSRPKTKAHLKTSNSQFAES